VSRPVSVLSVLAGLLAFAIAAVRGGAPVQDPDVFWLTWAGRRMLAGDLPRHNLASYTAPEHPWVLHEPLVAVAEAAVGIEQVVWLRTGVLAALAALCLALAARPERGWATVLTLAGLPIVLLFGLSERAMAWGLVALAGTTLLLFQDGRVRAEPWRLAAATAVVWIWANTHGSFVVGLGLILLVHPAWAALAGLLALLNPAGPAVYGLVFTYATGGGTTGRLGEAITEWGWLDPTDPGQLVPLLWVVGAGILLWTGPLADRRATWTARLLHAGLLLLTLRSWRNAPVAGLILTPFLAARLAALVPERPLGQPGFILGPLLALALPLVPWGPPDPARFAPALPGHVAPDERVWADHALGGFLMLHGVPVFWDGRNDCYPVAVWDEAITVTWRREGWERVLDRWGVDVVLTENEGLIEDLGAAGWVRRATEGRVEVWARPAEAASTGGALDR
jgi:hypothetical protein